ncbi:hypothetical protein PaecuDRAFT_2763 [Paenibacillus curdlanolyticus YK9]|uniref:Uncharacterized protein n=1 Tax=Paenibacillus curdlanolyticus YK9 TaxID=717606 RepID=E0IB36_9BACL|nr:hypothetical protein [Paenibacillus curdlanolyticus]EFM10327.1 hypothetical protein PaecuDRAFT_2763 [Paenibacillus curdlanolyticus YK9]
MVVEGWVTALVVVFGILVAVVGVIAYLRMFRKGADAVDYRSATGEDPSRSANPSQLADSQLLPEDRNEEQ